MKDNSIIAITYADSEFRRAGRALGVRVLTKGIDKFILYRRDDLSPEFLERNLGTLQHKRGAGYWIWKSQIIRQTLDFVKHGELLLYLDAGVLLKRSGQELSDLVTDDKIHVWSHRHERLGDWTDPKVLSKLKFSESLKSSPLIMGGAILARNTENFRDFVIEWGKLCEKPELLHPDSSPSYSVPENIVWHRHDQSLLSVLVALNPNRFVVHREDSDRFDMHRMFDIHRNTRIKTKGLVFSFPELRRFRVKITRALPNRIASSLKVIWYEHKRKSIPSIEAQRVQSYIRQRVSKRD
jgi:hypothetical protein